MQIRTPMKIVKRLRFGQKFVSLIQNSNKCCILGIFYTFTYYVQSIHKNPQSINIYRPISLQTNFS